MEHFQCIHTWKRMQNGNISKRIPALTGREFSLDLSSASVAVVKAELSKVRS